MRFTYHPDAGNDFISIQGELYNHIYQVRRTKFQENLQMRNLRDENIYTYEHVQISKKQADLRLVNHSESPNSSKKKIHLIWAIIEGKNIERTLPYLNQLGVMKISFFYAARSQKNEKINLERLHKILIHSCEQCGRTDFMNLEVILNTSKALELYPDACVFDFGGKNIYHSIPNFSRGIFLGPEGGFNNEEKELMKDRLIYSTNEDFILKSECGALFLSSIGY
ncbi:16S rRNA (uracil(1498)-N(3))-methyltransferase [Helicobacter cappadocius]|uniref:Ribosomal RNA small subunit methyltransferase E n=1 Tax=Helicobacter cappadocius TaxID=3063998 RepID=A0AA90PVS9_9HELI|nr:MULTISPECIES: 16S rRNA (uracil(1498)-N(3))-methyltransferase [unclassified Helicobacter]MDO7253246.1 16S rRNA (uracil(1498)-N(3))-methyltransferase [Helicobacter sp. faydin-H75]MDP2539170.1 16S rRNA (uracil(1498)-N(3))-methyltransferase [Helicobacter sp. faydin-H76]